MSVASKSTPELDPLAGVPDPAEVREQLQRLLVHPLFANSKRYPALLAHVVEQTLLGNAADLKERSIGIEVFGRSPSYDANADPVVRITAGEVRKRLSQYYYDASHTGQLVVELPIGSYVPLFRLPGQPAQQREHAGEPARESGGEAAVPALESAPPAATPPAAVEVTAHPAPRHIPWLTIVLCAVVFGAIGVGIGFRYHPRPAVPPPSNLDRFWDPIVSSANPATFCLGVPAQSIDTEAINNYQAPTTQPSKPEDLSTRLRFSGNLALADVITLTRTAAPLEVHRKSFRVVPASEASFAQLREGPIVLIGAFDNIWTLRVTQKLRFGFESRNGVAVLVDRKSPQSVTWATAWDLPYQKLARDYAVVARIHDRTTGQPVIIAAGIAEEGTEAAGEVLYNPVYLDSLLAKAPPDWEQKNLEAVIETQVIQGHSGPPNVVAVETW